MEGPKIKQRHQCQLHGTAKSCRFACLRQTRRDGVGRPHRHRLKLQRQQNRQSESTVSSNPADRRQICLATRPEGDSGDDLPARRPSLLAGGDSPGHDRQPALHTVENDSRPSHRMPHLKNRSSSRAVLAGRDRLHQRGRYHRKGKRFTDSGLPTVRERKNGEPLHGRAI